MVSYDSETKIGTVHLTKYAQKTLGDVVFVELPEVGDEFKQGGKLFGKHGDTLTNGCYGRTNWCHRECQSCCRHRERTISLAAHNSNVL